MHPPHGRRGVQVRERARHPEHPVIAAGGELHALGGLGEQRAAGGVGGGGVFQQRAVGLGVGADAGRGRERLVALRLDRAGAADALADRGAEGDASCISR